MSNDYILPPEIEAIATGWCEQNMTRNFTVKSATELMDGDLGNLIEALEQRGFSKEELEKAHGALREMVESHRVKREAPAEIPPHI